MLDDRTAYRYLVAANRILAKEGVVDAFGHVSLRHPERPGRYVLARSLGPALVTLADLMEFEQDGTPVDRRGRAVYPERMIHGTIYEARPGARRRRRRSRRSRRLAWRAARPAAYCRHGRPVYESVPDTGRVFPCRLAAGAAAGRSLS
ncbi:MAG: hypothetical protein EXQ97_08180 [Alphaproteobacteria bacterium]|nr:hypothetical protein [Alphaproteobacteria bacterium]